MSTICNLPKTCPYCNGTGKMKQVGMRGCPECHATGRDQSSTWASKPCRNCSGTGQVFVTWYDTCLYCKDGKIY